MRAAVFGAFVSRVGAGTGVATLDAKWSLRGADGWTLGFSLADLLEGALAEGWVRWSVGACQAGHWPEKGSGDGDTEAAVGDKLPAYGGFQPRWPLTDG